jgi:hypothetical protein
MATLSDPYELHYLAGFWSHTDVALKQHLISCMVEIGEPRPIIEPPQLGLRAS